MTFLRAVKLFFSVLGVLFVVAFLLGNGLVFLFEVPLVLSLGWIPYLQRTVQEVQVAPGALAEAGVVLAVLVVGVHHFATWWAREREATWGMGRTLGLVTAVVLMFAVSIASAGVAHQVAWLAGDDLLESSWALRPRSLQVCLDLVEQPDPLMAVGSEPGRFEVDTYAFRFMDVPDAMQVLMWPRDPARLQDEGAVICDVLGGVGTLEVDTLERCLTLPASASCSAEG